MKYLSVCSGIEAASVAWQPLGWTPVGFSEVEPFPCSVLNHHYPDVPNFGDLTKWKDWDVPKFDVLCGGTPCQGFSVAGKRGGMDDPRSQLAWDFLGIAAKHRPRWVFWENVPGVLSSWSDETPADDRRAGERWWQTSDFDAFLSALHECGYGVGWSVMDAQYFGVAQRRNRVFVVGYLGDWRPATAVLLDRESLSGNPAPSRQTGQGTASTLSERTKGGGGLGTDFDLDGGLIATPLLEVGARTNGDAHSGHRDEHGLVAVPLPDVVGALNDGAHNGGGSTDKTHTVVESSQLPEVAYCLQQRDHKGSDSDTKEGHLIPTRCIFDEPSVFDPNQITSKANRSVPKPGTAHTLPATPNSPIAFNLRGREGGAQPEVTDVASMRAGDGGLSRSYIVDMAVRRLTPRECERLQGFPDDYTLVDHRGKPAADGPRYKALGNSWAVPNVRWIGERMAMVEELLND